MNNLDQKHPLAHIDRGIVRDLLMGEETDYNLVELARLKIRYRNFPGARDIQNDIETIILQWGLTEDELFEKTKQIHAEGKIYRKKIESQEDWS